MATLKGFPALRLLMLASLILANFVLTQQAAIEATDSGSYYTAGVVEFRSSSNWSDNLAAYVEIIGSSDASATDIIVFPEATLASLADSSFAPAPEQLVAPCLSDPNAEYYAQYVVAISCAARNASKYVVINFSERQLCSDTPEDPRPCAANGYNVFNTNLVFDRSGVVISRYRKVNLYGEPRNTTYLPEHVTFETDFNVTFGHFICFDILFYTPVQELIDQGVRDFVYPTMWFSQLPFLTAVQTQLGWAYSNDVNLLAAGSSYPSIGSSGTGIFHGQGGTRVSVMTTGTGERRLYVAEVPKYTISSDKPSSRQIDNNKSRHRTARDLTTRTANSDNFFMKRDHLEKYRTEELDLSLDREPPVISSLFKTSVCDGDICCEFEVSFRPSAEGANGTWYRYRLGAYDGWRSEDNGEGNYLRNCAIFSCTGPELADCGKLGPPEMVHRVTFTTIVIQATFPKSSQFLPMPNTLLDNLLPLEPSQFEWQEQQVQNGNALQLRFNLYPNQEINNLFTFGIYGNYYHDECTYGKGTVAEDIECGYTPPDNGGGGDGAAELFAGPWVQLILATSVVLQLIDIYISI